MTLSKNSHDILRIAIPSIISNISVPLLGLVDMAITGHLGSETYIGAISVGGTVFNMIYWIFNFLRFGTGALTSQAYGRRSLADCSLSLMRSLLICMLISLVLVVFQSPIKSLAFGIMAPSAEVLRWAGVYFDICIYGSFGFLGLFAFTGWYVGMQNTRIPLLVSISQNIINIVASLIFVYCLDMGVAGIAYGTLIAQLSGFAIAAICCRRYYWKVLRHLDWHKILDGNELMRFFKINSAIFLRTICVVAVTVYIPIAGSQMGDTVLAANAVLMQFFMMYTFFIDGFAYAGEAICGKYFGAENYSALQNTIGRLFRFGWAVGIGFVIIYAICGHLIIGLLTDQAQVVDVAGRYFWWVLMIPVAGVGAFTWDGIYVGCGHIRSMLMCALCGAVAFFVLWFSLSPHIGNHALWLAFVAYLFMRGLVLRISARKKFFSLAEKE